MWRKDGINVNKMLKRMTNKSLILKQGQSELNYPHVARSDKNKLWLNKSLKQTINIFTPLIVVIIFYI